MREIAWFLAVVGGMHVSTYAESLQERMGYDASDRLLIIHADDAGMCHTENVATIRGMEEGVVTSASIMMPCPWVPEIVEYCAEHPDADFGLHITLNCEWERYRWGPLAPRDKVAGLLDPAGYLWESVQETATHATPEEVEREIRAQVETALHNGLKPTHLDTHMGTIYARGDYLQAALKIAREYGIPFMIPDLTPQVIERWGARRFLTDEHAEKLRASGIPLLTGLYMQYEHKGLEDTREEYHEIIRNLSPGVSQLIVHLGEETTELKSITNSWHIRENDYRIMTDPETKKVIEEAGVQLVTWREVQKAWLETK